MKLFIRTISILSLVLLLGSFTLYGGGYFRKLQPAIHAEDDEEEQEQEDENEREDEQRDESEQKEKTQYVVEYVPVQGQPTQPQSTLPLTFTIDTDGDKLVDAIDPHPTISELKFFTDTDNDTVADAYDVYTGEDDFKYVLFTDDNHNGILDSLE